MYLFDTKPSESGELDQGSRTEREIQSMVPVAAYFTLSVLPASIDYESPIAHGHALKIV